MTNQEILQGLKTVSDYSKQIEVWAISIFGGSLLVLMGTSYDRPKNRKEKMFYLIFVPSWFFLGLSVYESNYLQRLVLGALFSENHEVLISKVSAVNSIFANQQDYFYLSLATLVLWILWYLIWWIFFKKEIN